MSFMQVNNYNDFSIIIHWLDSNNQDIYHSLTKLILRRESLMHATF